MVNCEQKIEEELDLCDFGLIPNQNMNLIDNNYKKSLGDKRIEHYQNLESENRYQQKISDLQREIRSLVDRVEHYSKKYDKLEAEVLANVDNSR